MGLIALKEFSLSAIAFRIQIFHPLLETAFFGFCFPKAKENTPKLSFPFLQQGIAPFFEDFGFKFKGKLSWKWYLQELAQSWALLLPALKIPHRIY